jgi:hypothetical protein
MHVIWIAEAVPTVFFDFPQLYQLISLLGTEKKVAIILSLSMHRALHWHEIPCTTPVSGSNLADCGCVIISALGQKRTCAVHWAASALGQKQTPTQLLTTQS